MSTLLSICLGIGLSAACGFRIFVPPLVMSIAAVYGHLPLSESFGWIGTYPALIAFAVATLIEVAAYYIPWLDNLLDTVATPTAIAAGTVVTASLIPESDPFVQWTVALIAGGGSAGVIQSFSGLVRLASTLVTGGLGNGIIATLESGMSVFPAWLAIAAPVLAVSLVAVLLVVTLSQIGKRLARSQKAMSVKTIESD